MGWKDVFALIGVIHTAVALLSFCASIHAGYQGFPPDEYMRAPYAFGLGLAGGPSE